MKAITLWQPWASLVIAGIKCNETRSWSTDYRGPLAIHAAKKPASEIAEFLSALDCVAFSDLLAKAGLPIVRNLPRGTILGTVDLIDCGKIKPVWNGGVMEYTVADFHDGLLPIVPSMREKSMGDYTPGRFAWRLANPVAFAEPIPCRGMQGLWTVPAGLPVSP